MSNDSIESWFDLSHLRSITEGDMALEQEIFRLFYDSMDRCLNVLAEVVEQDPEGRWSDTVHEMKGMAANIGAHGLYGICEAAGSATEAAAKQHFLQQIAAEYQRIREHLISITY